MNSNRRHISYTFNDISRYLNGGMTPAEMHELERAALQDPFLADAIEGYREANVQQSLKHLDEITAAIQSEKAESKVIVMPQKRSYTWLAAASVIAVISISIFVLYPSLNKQTSAPLAQNKVKAEEQRDTVLDSKTEPASPLAKDSTLPATSALPSLPKRNRATEKGKAIEREQESASDLTPLPASSPPPSGRIISPSYKGEDSGEQAKAIVMNKQSLPVAMDTQNQMAESASGYMSTRAKVLANTWTTDKGKPFVLSEVEEIQVGKKRKKTTDTAATKPEGGWQSFQEYLFSKLSKKDTLDFINASRFSSNLELEFSLNEKGTPYNITVLHAQDSTTAKTVADAVKQGPKWITTDKKGKRLNIQY